MFLNCFGRTLRKTEEYIQKSHSKGTKSYDQNTKLTKLRNEMRRYNLDALLIPSEDAHQSEYTSECDKRRAFICGFKGSAGYAIVTLTQAALWTDGRYFAQAEKELEKGWTLMRQGDRNVPTKSEWLNSVLHAHSKIGIDLTLESYDQITKLKQNLNPSYIIFETKENLIDKIWKDRPKREMNPIFVFPTEYSGKSTTEKILDVQSHLIRHNQDYLVLSALDEVAWFLNLRGSDIPYNPVFFAYVVIPAKECPAVYLNSTQLTKDARKSLFKVTVKPYDSIFSDLTALSDSRVCFGSSASYRLVNSARKNTISVLSINPVEMMKGIKNKIEVEGIRFCHQKDAAALCLYFGWLENEVCQLGNKSLNETNATRKLDFYRSVQKDFKGKSFDTISAVGANAAIIHYKPEESTAATINTNEIYLCDSGGQYLDGTTDVTRTLHFGTPSDFEKQCFTLVLKGNINLDQAVFPKGVNGYQLDAIARMPLWSKGLDYRHGTGHGVGHFLNVHEGPHGIGSRSTYSQVALQEGMIVSNEPGYYEDGKFGIRIENIGTIIKAAERNETEYMTMECLTLVPIQQKMIDWSLLGSAEIDWLNEYNQKIRKKVLPLILGNSLVSYNERVLGYEWVMKETEIINKD